jgi:hypothetical protein
MTGVNEGSQRRYSGKANNAVLSKPLSSEQGGN